MTDIESRGLFLRGGFVPSSSGKTFPVYDPHTDEVYAKVAEAGTADVDAAVDAAREAFDGPWSALAPKDRGRLLLKLARMIQEHGEALAQVEARNSGHPIRDVRRFDLVRTVDWFEYFGGMAPTVQSDAIRSARKRLGGRREARPPSGRREDLLHRIRRGRTGHHPSGGRHAEETPPGTRRERPEHRLRGRGPRGRGPRIPVRRVPQPGTGVHRGI